ncbi:alpha/beta fold hydrolase [Candidatus Woesebacteria bacterium]|nr:alpha/beta fold hydrolase [Candidatus Woesebacteria bacterium]
MREIAQFELVAGKKIFAILSVPENKSKLIVIMNHGFKGSSVGASRSFVNFSRLLVKNGVSVLRFDQPCSGNSEGDFAQSSFNEWVDTTAYFAQKYLNLGYQVLLLGHSMGANAALIATHRQELQNRIPILLLWAPDPKTNPTEWFMKDAKLIDEQKQLYEEAGQQFQASFWQEVYDGDFFKCLDAYQGKIHLVYGENDRFVTEELRTQVIQHVEDKKQAVMILQGQDHLAWEYDSCTRVFNTELEFLTEYSTQPGTSQKHV